MIQKEVQDEYLTGITQLSELLLKQLETRLKQGHDYLMEHEDKDAMILMDELTYAYRRLHLVWNILTLEL